jgi:hypothetical protein
VIAFRPRSGDCGSVEPSLVTSLEILSRIFKPRKYLKGETKGNFWTPLEHSTINKYDLN